MANEKDCKPGFNSCSIDGEEETVEKKVAEGYSLSLLVSSYTTQNYSHAYSDILTYDDRNSHTIGYTSCSRKRLKDTNRST